MVRGVHVYVEVLFRLAIAGARERTPYMHTKRDTVSVVNLCARLDSTYIKLYVGDWGDSHLAAQWTTRVHGC